MSDFKALLKWFITISVLHSYAKGVYYLDHSIESRRSSNPSQNSTERLYSPWSEWTACSRTCDVGVTMRTRTCQKSILNSRGKTISLCHGESVEHKICKLKDCPPGTPDLRSLQCAEYNHRVVAGQLGRIWLPVNGGGNPCELRCEAKTQRLIYGFGKAIDGTPCSSGVCLDGRCLSVGCDERIGSGGNWDMCGVCGGLNATCVHYMDIFFGQPTVVPGQERRTEYQEIVVIPIGARNLEIRQETGDNVLAIRDRNTGLIFYGQHFQGDHRIAGTAVSYARADNVSEILTAKGPTALELYVLVLLRSRNLGIHYQYWLPVDQSPSKRSYPTLATHSAAIPTPSYTQFHSTLTSIERQSAPPTKAAIRQIGHLTSKPKIYESEKPTQKQPPALAKPSASSPKDFTNYGPKRKGLILPQDFQVNSSPRTSFKDIVGLTENSLQSSTAASTTNVRFFPAQNGFIVGHKPIYRTRKPDDGYYQTFRNKTLPNPVNIYQRRPDTLPLQTQRDSSSSNDRGKYQKAKWNVLHTSKDKNHQPQVVKSSPDPQLGVNLAKHNDFGPGNNLNSRWAYTFGGKKNDLLPEASSKRGRNEPTPISIAVLPLPETKNNTKTRKGKRKGGMKHQSKSRLTRGGLCEPCQKIRDQTRHFCISDFVIRASIVGYEFLHGETRYELQVLQSFKNTLALMPREYIWAPDTCRCPKLRIGKEYLVMGRSDSSYRKNESRLLIDKNCFVRTFNVKYSRRLHRLRKEQIRKCAKVS